MFGIWGWMRKRFINWICRKPGNGALNEVMEVWGDFSFLGKRPVQPASQVWLAGLPVDMREGSMSWQQHWFWRFCNSKLIKMFCYSNTIKIWILIIWKSFSVFCSDAILGCVPLARVCRMASIHWSEKLNIFKSMTFMFLNVKS